MEASQPQHVITGALFDGPPAGRPKYRGVIEVDGVPVPVVIWANVSAGGKAYLSVRNDRPKPDAVPDPDKNTDDELERAEQLQAEFGGTIEDDDNTEDIPF